MMNLKKKIVPGVVLILLLLSPLAVSGDIRSTAHNLSLTGPGNITASSEGQICVFCHIPHRQQSALPYLWNRSAPSSPYIPYDSSTLGADVGQPTGSSRMYLSCHDGTIALGAVSSAPTEIPFKGGMRYIPGGESSHLGTDLSDDHPVSFVYDAALSLENDELKDPSLLPPSVKLDSGNHVQCTTCHDPHDDPFGQFLVMDNAASSLCNTCHEKRGWNESSHSLSDGLLVRSGGLWPNTDYRTVAENGCENCHIPHSAATGERLLIFGNEEDTCLSCHDGEVASADIGTSIFKRYHHPVEDTTGVHDAAEDFTSGNVPKHVECSDCHDAHQANEDPSIGDAWVSGANKGTAGVSAGGMFIAEAHYVYEICFKCHGDNNVIDALPIARQIDQLNARLEFNPANPSFHPVGASGKNPDVPTLLSPYTVNSIISCTDCHGNSDLSGPPGPHGSDYPYLLIDRYVTDDSTPESPNSYALCYTCHSRSILLENESYLHEKHVVDQSAPCSACHDAHGVSSMQGNSLNNSHLINFDMAIVLPDNIGRLEYTDLGRFRGECSLICHGKAHDSNAYPQ
jgi:predicted CXXCH cytochrome family protein